MNTNKKFIDKLKTSIITILVALITFIINETSMTVTIKSIIVSVVIFVFLIIIWWNYFFTFNKSDKKAYHKMQSDVEKIERILFNINANSQCINVTDIDFLDSFSNTYYSNTQPNSFSNKKASNLLKKLCVSLHQLEAVIWNNHKNNSNVEHIRLDFLGSNTGEYDKNKHGEENANKEKFKKSYLKSEKYCKKFKAYCENQN